MEFTQENIDEIVKNAWLEVKNKIEGGHLLSSEKTLVFLFALEIFKIFDNVSLVIDFENQCYNNLEGRSKYLDLLFYTNTNFKVAIEFKLPKRSSNGNSNQTQNRKNVYRDLARLKFLKDLNENFNACYFLMAVNENAYLNNAGLTVEPNFLTKHLHTINNGNNLSVFGLSLDDINCQFIWDNIVSQNDEYHCNGEFAWLTPIRV